MAGSRVAELLSRPEVAASKKSRQRLETDLDHLQAHIEMFYDDEPVLPPGTNRVEDAVPFVEWSRQVCERVRAELDRSMRGR
jgi:hypothetical protein